MDQLWRYILFLIFLKIALMTFIYSLVSESPIAIINNRKRDNAHVHILMKSNTTVELIEDGIKNGNKTVFAQLKNNLAVTSKIPKNNSRRNVNANKNRIIKRTNQQLHALVKSKKSRILKSRHRMQHSGLNVNVTTLGAPNKQNITNGYESLSNATFNVPMKNQTFCTFSFDKYSLLQARRQLSQSINLFYVNLNIKGFHSSLNNVSDDILHWQYVLKDEKFLVQLPVDFDLLTYGLLIHDHEETILKVHLTYNKSNCLEQDDSSKIQIIRLLLWKELFHNDTKHYLCNRDFENQPTRNFVYYLTTVWVGEDLDCMGMSSDYELYKIPAKKDHLPLVTPVFCYILSLQFVWIFVLLDVKSNPNENFQETVDATNTETSPVASQSDETKVKKTFSGEKNDDTEDHQTVQTDTVTKTKREEFQTDEVHNDNKWRSLLYFALCPKHSQTCNNPVYTKHDRPYGLKRLVQKLLFYGKCCCHRCCLHSPMMRLLFFMWSFILIPVGLYRTVGRYYILRITYEDYINVFRPSESFIFLLYKFKPSISECSLVSLDAFYATVFPFVYIFLGQCLHIIFSSNDMQTCIDNLKDNNLLNVNNNTISDTFTFQYSRCWRKLNKIKCSKKCCKLCREDCKNCCSWCENIFTCLFSFISALFPIVPFVCFSEKYIKKCCCTCSSCCSTCCKKCCECTFVCFMRFIGNVIAVALMYIVCLRPIFSTFTFLLRSFTHFFFVALPNRIAVLRYVLIIVTTVSYFVKYVHELINMNAEILNYILKLKEKSSPQSNNTDDSDGDVIKMDCVHIDEKMFDDIYNKLTFVKKRFYFLYLKMIVVLMYLIITTETFITNKTALTGPNFQQILEFSLIIIGPYAISFFLKANKDDFLTEENKRDIKRAFMLFNQSVKPEHLDSVV